MMVRRNLTRVRLGYYGDLNLEKVMVGCQVSTSINVVSDEDVALLWSMLEISFGLGVNNRVKVGESWVESGGYFVWDESYGGRWGLLVVRVQHVITCVWGDH